MNSLLRSRGPVITRGDYEKCTAVNRPKRVTALNGGKRNEVPFANEPGRSQINEPGNCAFETSPTIGVLGK
jgi:hypothetical protein